MLTSRFVALVERNAPALTRAALKDFSFYRTPPYDLEAQISAAYHNLGKWIGDLNDDAVRAEYESLGATRFRQGVPLAEAVYTLVLVKHHLLRFVRDRAMVDLSGDRVVTGFFDRAMYYLARGYGEEATREDDPAAVAPAGQRAAS
jgi:hypothetical protein